MLTKWLSVTLSFLPIGLIDLATSFNLIEITGSFTFLTKALTSLEILVNSSFTKFFNLGVESTEVINSLRIFFCSGSKSL